MVLLKETLGISWVEIKMAWVGFKKGEWSVDPHDKEMSGAPARG
jgi:hypothetical protein